MFIQMLEGLHKSEAEVVCYAKDKILHQKYKGLSDAVVKSAFGWTDDYWMLTVTLFDLTLYHNYGTF